MECQIKGCKKRAMVNVDFDYCYDHSEMVYGRWIPPETIQERPSMKIYLINRRIK